MDGLIDITCNQDLQKLIAGEQLTVVHFWATWCEPCKQLDLVLAVLAKDHPANFARVEAEEVTDVSIEFEIAVVPLFLFFKGGKLIDRLEGADIPALTDKVNKHCPATPNADQTVNTANGAGTVAGSMAATGLDRLAPLSEAKLNERVKGLINSQPVMLFMKGSPDAPRCGFSARVVKILRWHKASFGTFDILSDEAIRQGVKKYSDWPTFPQLYIRGDLVGGCDIIEEMDASGELDELLGSTSASNQGSLEEQLKGLINSKPVMLFMKGTPDAPRCGFSRRVVEALRRDGVQDWGSFDILQNEEVREGLKKLSDWPTFPQLYAGGELLGGCDIVLEMQQQGDLKRDIQEMLAAKQGPD